MWFSRGRGGRRVCSYGHQSGERGLTATLSRGGSLLGKVWNSSHSAHNLRAVAQGPRWHACQISSRSAEKWKHYWDPVFPPRPVRHWLARFPASAASPAPCPRCPASGKLKVVGFVSNLQGRSPGPQVTCMSNLVQIVQEMKKFLGPWNFPPGRAGRQASYKWRAPPHQPLVPASGKLKVVEFVSNLMGGRPWSQVTCMPNLVQIVQELKKFLGLRFSPGRAGSGLRAGREPRGKRRLTGPGKLKVVGFVSNLVGGRSWSQVRCMPNLVQIVQEMKNFLGVHNFSPGRPDSGFPASAASPAPCPSCPASGKKSCRIRLKFDGRSPMVPSAVHAKYGADSPRNKKVLGTPFFPGPGRQWPRQGGGWLGVPPHRPPRPRVCASENFKVLGSGPNSVCRQGGTGRGRRRSIGAVLRAGAEPRPFVPRRRPSRQRLMSRDSGRSGRSGKLSRFNSFQDID